jgi:general secretion pathway protein C
MAFAGFAKRNFVIVIGSAIVLSAFLSARGVAHIAEAAVAVDAKMIAAAPTQAAPIEPAKNEKSADAILARNPFDSLTGSLHDATESVALQDAARTPKCDGVKILIIAQAADPDWSFAALSSGEADAKSQLRRRGGDFGGKKVELIDWDRVWFLDHGSFCQVELFPTHQPDTQPAKKEAPKNLDPAIARGIHRTSATQFEIDRGVLDKILENQAELMKVRVVPEQDKGAPIGIRLFGIKEDSLFGAIGLENGDRIESLNGLELNSPAQALEAYARLRVAEHLRVQINRKGAEMQIDYDIR